MYFSIHNNFTTWYNLPLNNCLKFFYVSRVVKLPKCHWWTLECSSKSTPYHGKALCPLQNQPKWNSCPTCVLRCSAQPGWFSHFFWSCFSTATSRPALSSNYMKRKLQHWMKLLKGIYIVYSAQIGCAFKLLKYCFMSLLLPNHLN